MSFLSWFDNRTLFSCQLLLAIVFSVVFYGMRRANPTLRGIGSVALSFLFGAPGILLLFLRGSIPDFLSMTVANALVLIAFTLEYRAILSFLGVSRPMYPIWILNAVTLMAVFYYSEVRHDIVARIIVSSIAIAIIRGLVAFELLRQARGRTHMLLFGYAMTLFTVMSFSRALISYLNGSPSNYMQNSPFQTLAMAGDLIYVCVTGLFFCAMISSEALARVRNQSEQDPLSGTLNRRGIEHKLSTEIKRIERIDQRLSVALIDIDFFKAINDSEGHAAGDNALRKVVTAIAGQIRACDFVGRYGGDEFLLIFPHTCCVDAVVVAERIGNAVRSFSMVAGGAALTLSIGLSETVPGEDPAFLLARADQALYQAKHAGRNCTRIVLHGSDNATSSRPYLVTRDLSA